MADLVAELGQTRGACEHIETIHNTFQAGLNAHNGGKYEHALVLFKRAENRLKDDCPPP